MAKLLSIETTPGGVRLINHLKEGDISPFEVTLMDDEASRAPNSVNIKIRLSPVFVERLFEVLEGMDLSERGAAIESKEEAFKEGVLRGAEIAMIMCQGPSG